MSSPPTVRVSLASRPDNVALIREVVAALAEVVDLGPALDDVKAAVSEAANNVVLHAYEGREGPLEVDLRLLPTTLEVLVRDLGVGIASEAAVADQIGNRGVGHGLGLAVMESLADRLELRPRSPHGLEVALAFALGTEELAESSAPEPAELPWLAAPDGAVHVALSPASLSSIVLARLVVALGARAGFSIDRLSDAQLVADALAAQITLASAGPLVLLAVKAEERRLELQLGGFEPGRLDRALAGSAIGELGALIGRLADEAEVRSDGAVELLSLVMVEERAVAARHG
jgi:anti-sigma regulatory factor (Ser/Thr protein kinase)